MVAIKWEYNGNTIWETECDSYTAIVRFYPQNIIKVEISQHGQNPFTMMLFENTVEEALVFAENKLNDFTKRFERW